MSKTTKSKSAMRFQQLNIIVDRLLRHLPARHGLALLVFYRHADVNRRFRVSANDLSKTLNIDLRTARSLFDDLEILNVIHMVEPRRGTIPRVFVITGKVASEGVSPHTRDSLRSIRNARQRSKS